MSSIGREPVHSLEEPDATGEGAPARGDHEGAQLRYSNYGPPHPNSSGTLGVEGAPPPLARAILRPSIVWAVVSSTRMTAPDATDDGQSRTRRLAALLRRIDPFVVLVAVLVVLPIVAVVVQLHGVDWYPTGDLAQAELRMIRFFDHPPLVGAAGRIANEQGVQGNHPGPAMFWGIWPLWWLLGGSSWAFAASTALLNLGGAATTVWLVSRRLGRHGAVIWSLALGGLIAGFGLDALTQAWNPWVALVPFAVFFLAVWGFVDGDTFMLPIAVAAGSWCLQSHVGYIVPVPLLLGAAMAFVVFRRRRLEPRSMAAAFGVGVAMWALPVYQQLTQSPGNLSILYANFTNPEAKPFGFSTAVKTSLQLLNPAGAWVRAETTPVGSIIPGALVAAVWLGCVALCIVWGRATIGGWSSNAALVTLTRLHALVAVGWLASVIAISRVFGEFFIYTFRWAVIVSALMFVAVVATAVQALVRGPAVELLRSRRVALAAISVTVLAALSVSTMVQISHQEIPYGTGWKTEAKLAPQVLAQLDRHDRYHVLWEDPISLGGLGFGLMLAADRAGFTVQTDAVFAAGVEAERVGNRGDADAELHVITGPAIIRWQRFTSAKQLAYVDNRTAAEQAEYTRTQRQVFDEIGVQHPDWNAETPMFAIMSDPLLSAAGHRRVDRLVNLGQPTAVFLTAPNTNLPQQ